MVFCVLVTYYKDGLETGCLSKSCDAPRDKQPSGWTHPVPGCVARVVLEDQHSDA